MTEEKNSYPTAVFFVQVLGALCTQLLLAADILWFQGLGPSGLAGVCGAQGVRMGRDGGHQPEGQHCKQKGEQGGGDTVA